MNNYAVKILSHEFSEENREDALPYMTELMRGNSYTPSELEKYSLSVMGWIHRLSNCFKSLEHTRVYMDHFRSNKWYREAGIVKSNYINYHYFKYVITVVTIMDVCLILTNDTFRLGNPERLCYFENIIKNSWVSSSKVGKELKKLSKLVEPWREPRNLYIHRGWEMYRERLTALEGYELLQEKGVLDRIRTIPSHRIKSTYKTELSEIYKEFDTIEAPLFDAVMGFLSKLLPVYISQRERLQQTL